MWKFMLSDAPGASVWNVFRMKLTKSVRQRASTKRKFSGVASMVISGLLYVRLCWYAREHINVDGLLFRLDPMAVQKIEDDLFVLSGQGGHHHLLVLTAHEVDAGFFRQSQDVAPGGS